MKLALKPLLVAVALVAGGIGLTACGTTGGMDDSSKMGITQTEAVATLSPTEGNSAAGTVQFIEQTRGVRVIANLTGLEPGAHGFHIHEHGDCSAPDASSAGGHYAPRGNRHGSPDDEEHHIGDLGNITADENGRVHLDKVYDFLSLEGEYSILGRGVVVHSNADDFESQPSGNAGSRVLCGVVEKR